jgi:O-antigen ligase/polysaccharide polymerase Wzy-like membrane protein
MWTTWRSAAFWIPLGLGIGMAGVLSYRPQAAFQVLLLMAALVVLVACAARPLWGVCLAAMLDLFFSYVQTLRLPPRNYLLSFMMVLVLIRFLQGGMEPLPRSAYRLLLAIGFLVTLAVIMTVIGTPSLLDALYGLGGGLGAGLAIAACVAFFVNDERDALTFVGFVALCLMVSSVVALLQFAGVEAAWRLRESLGEESAVLGAITARVRPPGLTYFAIQLSYQLVSVIPLVGSLWLATRANVARRRLYGLVCAILILGLAATLTRSALGGAVAGLGTVILLARRRQRVMWLTIIAVLTVAVIGFFDLSERRGLTTDQLMSDRLPHFITAVRIAWDNPFGIGGLSQFNEYAAQYYAEIADLPGAEAVLKSTAHNQFLNILVAFGIFGLFGLLWFYRALFKLLGRVRRDAHGAGVRTLAAGLIGGNVGYIINASFHNPGPFSGDLFSWYWIGLSVALARIAARDAGAERGTVRA